MDKKEVIDKLKSLGIDTTNVYNKKTFLDQNIVVVSMFESELREDFYFWNERDNKIYKLPGSQNKQSFTFEVSSNRYFVPFSLFLVVWEDKPYRELPDKPFSNITVREYACIHLGIPNSGNEWLDNLIIEYDAKK